MALVQPRSALYGKNMGDLSLFAVHVKMAGGQGMSPVPPDFTEGKIFTVVRELAVTSTLKHQSFSLPLLTLSLRH